MCVPALDRLRGAYHDNLCSDILGQRRNRDGTPKFRDGKAVYNFADGDDRGSVLLAEGVTNRLNRDLCPLPPRPQTAGTLFTAHTCTFFRRALSLIGHLFPGEIFLETRPSLAAIARFDQVRTSGRARPHRRPGTQRSRRYLARTMSSPRISWSAGTRSATLRSTRRAPSWPTHLPPANRRLDQRTLVDRR